MEVFEPESKAQGVAPCSRLDVREMKSGRDDTDSDLDALFIESGVQDYDLFDPNDAQQP